MAIAVLLGLLSVGHVGVFGWRSITFDRRVTGDSMNYIDVARNLSAGEGLVQSAAGFNQPTFWERDFTPQFPEKTRAGHNPGYSVLIAAVAAVTGLEHADAAFVIGPAAYAAALASAFLFASRLLGPAAGLLAAAFVAHQIRWVFLRTWTEPVVIALLLALLALLARGATPRRAVVGGCWRGSRYWYGAASYRYWRWADSPACSATAPGCAGCCCLPRGPASRCGRSVPR